MPVWTNIRGAGLPGVDFATTRATAALTAASFAAAAAFALNLSELGGLLALRLPDADGFSTGRGDALAVLVAGLGCGAWIGNDVFVATTLPFAEVGAADFLAVSVDFAGAGCGDLPARGGWPWTPVLPRAAVLPENFRTRPAAALRTGLRAGAGFRLVLFLPGLRTFAIPRPVHFRSSRSFEAAGFVSSWLLLLRVFVASVTSLSVESLRVGSLLVGCSSGRCSSASCLKIACPAVVWVPGSLTQIRSNSASDSCVLAISVKAADFRRPDES